MDKKRDSASYVIVKTRHIIGHEGEGGPVTGKIIGIKNARQKLREFEDGLTQEQKDEGWSFYLKASSAVGRGRM